MLQVEDLTVNDNVVFAMRFGILVLCAIIGVYYALARKSKKTEGTAD